MDGYHFETWMAIKQVDYDGEPKVSIRLWFSNWNKDHVQMDFNHIIDSNDNGRNDGEFGKKMGDTPIQIIISPNSHLQMRYFWAL